MKKHLLIVYHSKSGNTAAMAQAVLKGCEHPDVDVEIRMLLAADAGLDDLLWADGLIIGTPENFGYMSGMIKDFLERTFYPAEGKVEGLPFCMFISAGNDGTGALRSMRRVCSGYPFKEVQEPLICQGPVTPETLAKCEEFGLYMAAGTEAAIF
jgi:multimeric flavodoxin WrbA